MFKILVLHLFITTGRSSLRAGPFAHLVSTWDTPWRIDLIVAVFGDRSKLYMGWNYSKTDHNLQPGTYSLLMRVGESVTQWKDAEVCECYPRP